MTKILKSRARKDLTKLIPNKITFLFVLSDRSLSNLLLLKFGNRHSQPHPLPHPPVPLGNLPQCFTILRDKSHFCLHLVYFTDPSQCEKSSLTSVLSTTDVENKWLCSSLQLFSYLRAFPLFFLPLDRFTHLQVCGLPTVQRTVENGLKYNREKPFAESLSFFGLYSHAEDKSLLVLTCRRNWQCLIKMLLITTLKL